MTARDEVWDCVFRIVTGEIDPSELVEEENNPWHGDSEFCHWEIIGASDKLDESNKRTIRRTLNVISGYGWIVEHNERMESDDWVEQQPIYYSCATEYQNRVDAPLWKYDE